MLILEVHDP
jgi:uncharacterized protein YPO0396